MIQLKKINSPVVEVFDPEGNLLGEANEYELLDLRVQIKEANVWGYYLIFNGQKIRIDRRGELEDYPIGLLDTMTYLLLKLIQKHKSLKEC